MTRHCDSSPPPNRSLPFHMGHSVRSAVLMSILSLAVSAAVYAVFPVPSSAVCWCVVAAGMVTPTECRWLRTTPLSSTLPEQQRSRLVLSAPAAVEAGSLRPSSGRGWFSPAQQRSRLVPPGPAAVEAGSPPPRRQGRLSTDHRRRGYPLQPDGEAPIDGKGELRAGAVNSSKHSQKV